MEILYEDNHCIAVRKPHGILVQGDASSSESLMDEVKAFVKARDKKSGNVFLGLIHRLDRPVGGVVVFAKTSKGASRLSEQFRNRTVEKVYWALVEGKPSRSSGDVIQWLVKDKIKNVVTPYDHDVPGSLRAELSFREIRPGLIEVYPKTGRPHQIRVAMASLGTPIVGDRKYGAKTGPQGVIALHARSLSFDQPVTKERVTVTAQPDEAIFGKLESL